MIKRASSLIFYLLRSLCIFHFGASDQRRASSFSLINFFVVNFYTPLLLWCVGPSIINPHRLSCNRLLNFNLIWFSQQQEAGVWFFIDLYLIVRGNYLQGILNDMCSTQVEPIGACVLSLSASALTRDEPVSGDKIPGRIVVWGVTLIQRVCGVVASGNQTAQQNQQRI